MDTKARVALFVGGLVVVGLVAWVLMPAQKAAEPSPVTEGSGDLAATPTSQPSIQPVALTDPFAVPATQPAALPSVVTFGGPAPATPAAAATADPNDAWARALDGNSATATMTGTNIPGTGGPSATGFPRPHRIQAGETFSSISEAAYGSNKYIAKIVAANPKVDPRHLRIGQEITLPDVNGSAAATATPTATPAFSAGDHGKIYKVQAGDNLRRISQKVYGTSDRWEKIYIANRAAIGSDPSHLRAGQTLQIP